MTIECIESSDFQLIYGQVDYGSLNNFSWNGTEYELVQNIKPKNGGRLTWNFEEARYKRKFAYYGSSLCKAKQMCDVTYRWWSPRNNFFYQDDTGVLSQSGRDWIISTIKENEDGSTEESNGTIKLITEDEYQALASQDRDYQIDQSDYNLRIPKVPDCDSNNSGDEVDDITIDGTIRYGVAEWEVTIYEDGKFYGEILKFSPDNEDRFDPPARILEGVDPDDSKQTTKDFFKIADTQGVEVIVDPSAAHRKLLYLVDLEDGQEVARSLLYSFESEIGQLAPEHQIICGSKDECPEDTCQVDCGNHYCCYNANGISVFSYSK